MHVDDVILLFSPACMHACRPLFFIYGARYIGGATAHIRPHLEAHAARQGTGPRVARHRGLRTAATGGSAQQKTTLLLGYWWRVSVLRRPWRAGHGLV